MTPEIVKIIEVIPACRTAAIWRYSNQRFACLVYLDWSSWEICVEILSRGMALQVGPLVVAAVKPTIQSPELTCLFREQRVHEVVPGAGEVV